MGPEQILEAVMTSTVVRLFEVLAAPIFIWFKSGTSKKDLPKPQLIGFIIIVFASSLFLEEKITGWVKQFTYSDQQVIREWLDEQKLSNTLESTKDFAFRFIVKGEITFEIIKKRDSQGIISFVTGLTIKPDRMEKIKKLSESQRSMLWSDLLIEFSRHGIYLPPAPSNSFLETVMVQRNFAFPPGSPKAALYQNLADFKGIRAIIDLLIASWEAQGKL